MLSIAKVTLKAGSIQYSCLLVFIKLCSVAILISQKQKHSSKIDNKKKEEDEFMDSRISRLRGCIRILKL